MNAIQLEYKLLNDALAVMDENVEFLCAAINIARYNYFESSVGNFYLHNIHVHCPYFTYENVSKICKENNIPIFRESAIWWDTHSESFGLQFPEMKTLSKEEKAKFAFECRIKALKAVINTYLIEHWEELTFKDGFKPGFNEGHRCASPNDICLNCGKPFIKHIRTSGTGKRYVKCPLN